LGTAAVIDVGGVQLLPNTPNQMVMFFASGTEQINGFQFRMAVGDGGAVAGGTDTGPVITAVDLVTGTPWQNANPNVGPAQPGLPNLVHFQAVDFNNVNLSNGARIATVTFDTTGITEEFLSLRLADTFGGLSSFFTRPVAAGGDPTLPGLTINNGTIQVGTAAAIPEPGSLLLLSLAGVAAGGWRYRRRRRAA
jgi:hypothetical protein